MALAALLVQAHPRPAVLHVNIFDLRNQHRANPREGIDHEANQGAVAQADWRSRIDAVEQDARFLRVEPPRLANFDDVPGTAHTGGGIGRDDLTRRKPIEQYADGGKPLLRRRRAVAARQRFDISLDVKRRDSIRKARSCCSH